jgi:hypothetical protein
MEALPATDVSGPMGHAVDTATDSLKDKSVPQDKQTTIEDIVKNEVDPEKKALLEQAQNKKTYETYIQVLKTQFQPAERNAILKAKIPELGGRMIESLLSPAEIQKLDANLKSKGFEKLPFGAGQDISPEVAKSKLLRYLSISKAQEQANANQRSLGNQGLRAVAQVSNNTSGSEAEKGTFIDTYLNNLLQHTGQKDQGDAVSDQAKQTIIAMVSPALANDVSDAITSVQTGGDDISAAKEKMEQIYDVFIAPMGQKNMEPTVMSEKKPKGIIKFNLSDHVIDNQTKTAASHFGEAYFTYGPTEKRICPKLRGKNMGDFVSEYICRHHCLDGIVIDDNKTVCGEAMWRANVMDKFSREYVNEDGDIVG